MLAPFVQSFFPALQQYQNHTKTFLLTIFVNPTAKTLRYSMLHGDMFLRFSALLLHEQFFSCGIALVPNAWLKIEYYLASLQRDLLPISIGVI